MTSTYPNWTPPKIIGMAQRVKFHDARRAFASGGRILVSERGHETDVPVTTMTTTHTRETTTWDALAESVAMWRNRYPNQRFYIVTLDADGAKVGA